MQRTYNYLEERRVGIRAPEEFLKILERNIEESGLEGTKKDCLLEIEFGDKREIVKDKSFPYDSIRTNNTRQNRGWDYFRYATPIQTIWQISPQSYFIRNQVWDHELRVLDCILKYYFEQNTSMNKLFFHASAIGSEDGGILIPGRCRSGKTTLAINLLERMKLTIIADSKTLLHHNGDLIASYIPRPIWARFSGISESPGLSQLLLNPKSAEATQYMDMDSIDRIIRARKFDLDVGINMSRRKFAELLGVKHKPRERIRSIIFPVYSANVPVSLKRIGTEEAIARLKGNAYPKAVDLGLLEIQPKIKSATIEIPQIWLEGKGCAVITYSHPRDLTKTILEDVLSI